MYSPTRKGFVKMMVSPAMRLPSTPCMAKPTPRPATPIPATSGAMEKPNLSRATTPAMTTMRSLMTRTKRCRMGGSICCFWKRRSTSPPSHFAAMNPTARMASAPST